MSAGAARRLETLEVVRGGTVDDVERGVLFLAPLLLFWITLRPLTDLSAGVTLAPHETGDLLAQIAYLALFAALAAKLCLIGWRQVTPLLHPVYLATLLWLAVSSVASVDPGVSMRRLVLSGIVMALVGIMLLLPRNVRQFSTWMGSAALVVVVLCYLAVAFFPHLAIHQADVLAEANLAGDWRGIYDHKSRTGPMLVVFILIAVFLLRQRRWWFGGSLLALSGVFLVFVGAKQPSGLIAFVLALSCVANRVGSRSLLFATVLVPLALYNLFTVGTAVFPALGAVDASVGIDPTFTDRTGIWRFAIANFLDRPWFGWGFQAFWNTGRTLYASTGGPDVYASFASHSHNSYLDLALTTGIPGLLLAFASIVVLPLLDYCGARRRPENRALATLFFQIWSLGLFTGAMETLFFQRDDTFWVSFLVAVFGLRYLASRPARP